MSVSSSISRAEACYDVNMDIKKVFPYSPLLQTTFTDYSNRGEYPFEFVTVPFHGLELTTLNGAVINMAPRTAFNQVGVGMFLGLPDMHGGTKDFCF